MSAPDFALPVDVRGDLQLVGPTGGTVALRADGSALILSARRWADLRHVGPGTLLARRRALNAAVRALRALGLQVDVEIAGRRAFGAGAGVRTSLLARLLRLRSCDIRLATLLSFLAR